MGVARRRAKARIAARVGAKASSGIRGGERRGGMGSETNHETNDHCGLYADIETKGKGQGETQQILAEQRSACGVSCLCECTFPFPHLAH